MINGIRKKGMQTRLRTIGQYREDLAFLDLLVVGRRGRLSGRRLLCGCRFRTRCRSFAELFLRDFLLLSHIPPS